MRHAMLKESSPRKSKAFLNFGWLAFLLFFYSLGYWWSYNETPNNKIFQLRRLRYSGVAGGLEGGVADSPGGSVQRAQNGYFK
jgi:hypothetical protein